MVQAGLELRQGQSLVMTQQLRQSITLLQFSTQELQDFIDGELEKNPLLKKDDGEIVESVADVPQETHNKDNIEPLPDMADADYNTDTMRYDNARDGATAGAGDDDIMSRLSNEKTLHEDVFEQLQCQLFSDLELKMTEVIVDMIDANGYLPADIDSRADQLGIADKTLANIISNIQQCEPTGVGARNLRECLMLQLDEMGELSPSMQGLLDNLEMVAQGQAAHKKLTALLDVTTDTLNHMLALVKSCNPKPGAIYDTPIVQTLIPEVLVTRNSDHIWQVELNQDILPKVLIDQSYRIQFKSGLRDKDDAKIINEHLANASWLVKALHQRSMTLIKVASEIVEQQQDFFNYGIQYLKPMTLKDIAAKAECHESTVSRITTSKYMATPRGVYELKYFFTSTLNNANGGEAYSSRSVMHLIKQITDAERADAILSDDAIAEKLNAQGIDVARRTVVKYRKLMNIPSSVQRRRIKGSEY